MMQKVKSYDVLRCLLLVVVLKVDFWPRVRFLSSDCILGHLLDVQNVLWNTESPFTQVSFFCPCVCEKQHEALVVFLFVLAASTPKKVEGEFRHLRKPVHWTWPNAWIQDWSSRILGFNGNLYFPRWEFRRNDKINALRHIPDIWRSWFHKASDKLLNKLHMWTNCIILHRLCRQMVFVVHSHAVGAVVVFLGRSKKWGSTGHAAAKGKGPKGELFFFARSEKHDPKNWRKCHWEWLRKSVW